MAGSMHLHTIRLEQLGEEYFFKSYKDQCQFAIASHVS
jgi:hypothetical protein